jgi:hypothetical protein
MKCDDMARLREGFTTFRTTMWDICKAAVSEITFLGYHKTAAFMCVIGMAVFRTPSAKTYPSVSSASSQWNNTPKGKSGSCFNRS